MNQVSASKTGSDVGSADDLSAITMTPWGDANGLRARMLRPGPGMDPEVVARNQRQRIFAAMVAVVANRGYERATVAQVCRLAGVSRNSFYRQFTDKQVCFVATVEATIQLTFETVSERYDGSGSPDVRAIRVLETVVELVTAQPAAARTCLVEIYAAGPAAIELAQRTLAGFQQLAGQIVEQMPGQSGMPAELSRAFIDGVLKVIYTRLLDHRESELRFMVPELWKWGMSYQRSPEPLRRPRRRVKTIGPLAWQSGSDDPAERIIDAATALVSAKGYAATTIAEIAQKASVSLRTFYSCFEGRQQAFLAALDSAQAQMLAAGLPAYRRTKDWPQAIRAAVAAMFGFLAAHPPIAQLVAVEVYAVGTEALAQRDRDIAVFEGLLVPGYERSPRTPPIAAEAIGGAIYALAYQHIRRRGAERLPEIVPLAVFIILAPFIGAVEACAVANGRSIGA